MKILKIEKGITLITLVITIVILIILAGISISTIVGKDGIINKAKESKIETEEKSNQEKVNIENSNKYIEYLLDSKGYPDFESYLLREKGYKLEWNDEFDGTKLDEEIWSYRDTEADNNEEEKWTNSNTEVDNGILKIIAKYDDKEGYTSSEIWTVGKRTVDLSTAGRVEASIEIPESTSKSGIWSAFWMMGNAPYSDLESGQWPICGEIDIMENINSLNTIYATVHGLKKTIYKPSSYDIGNLKQVDLIGWMTETGYIEYYDKCMSGKMSIRELVTSKGGNTKLDNKSGFHIYALEWEKNENDETILEFYLDENKFYQLNLEEEYGEFAKFFVSSNYKWYVIFDLAVGGDWPGKATSSEYPLEMKVDYVRYYTKSNQSNMNFDKITKEINSEIERQERRISKNRRDNAEIIESNVNTPLR